MVTDSEKMLVLREHFEFTRLRWGTRRGEPTVEKPNMNPTEGNAYSADCPTRQILDRIGDKWAVLVRHVEARSADRAPTGCGGRHGPFVADPVEDLAGRAIGRIGRWPSGGVSCSLFPLLVLRGGTPA